MLRFIGVAEGQTISIVVTCMGFATLSITQFRAAAAAAAIGVQASVAATHAAVAAVEVKTALETSTANNTRSFGELAETTKATHILVNNQRGVLLQALADLWERHACLTGTKDDQQSSKLAAIALADHNVQQAEVDGAAKSGS